MLVDKRINKIIKTLKKTDDVMIRVSNISDDMLIGNEKKTIISSIGSKKYRISPKSFFQVNSRNNKKNYMTIFMK